jgi:hypothetical protein
MDFLGATAAEVPSPGKTHHGARQGHSGPMTCHSAAARNPGRTDSSMILLGWLAELPLEGANE